LPDPSRLDKTRKHKAAAHVLQLFPADLPGPPCFQTAFPGLGKNAGTVRLP